MFGRPEWFKTRTISFRSPASFFGWLYMAGWAAAITVPTWMFLSHHRGPEALTWLAISSIALLWDRRHSRKAVAKAPPVIASTPEIINMQPSVQPASSQSATVPATIAPAAPKVTTESPFYISDAQPDITFVAERTRQSTRSWMPWSRRFRV